ncbi:MAG TPA: TetR/AcrR family transcriptional regulator [Ktedonobacteraceae bacterium]
MTGEHNKTQAKRTRMRGEERREFILNRAKEVFARCGYADASTGELARTSEVTEPMLYKHFGSKKGLFMAVIQQFGGRFMNLWRSRVNRRAEHDLLDALAQVIMEYRATLKADPDIQKVLLQAIAETSDPDIAQCIQRHNRNVYLLVRQLLERAQAEGYVDGSVDLNAASWGYVSMVFAMQYSLVLDMNQELTDEVMSNMSQLWLRALRAPAS